MFEIKELPGGGFNFGITNYKGDALEEAVVNTSMKKKVVIDKKLTYREESGYGIYQGEDEHGNRIKISGVFPKPLMIGNTYEVDGKVVMIRGEKHLSVDVAKPTRPVTPYGVISYLKNLEGLYRRAEILYECYGDSVIDIIMNDPMKIVQEIGDIEEETVLKWQEQIQAMESQEESLNQLLEYGLNLRQAKALLSKYKQEVIEQIKENPYLLVAEFPSLGFEKVDKIARELGYHPKGMYRIQEGIKHVLREANGDGHCYLPLKELIKKVANLLMIRLTEEEMMQLLKDFREGDIIDYRIGNYVFSIHYRDLSRQFKRYCHETNPIEKEKKRFLVFRLTQEEIKKELDYLVSLNQLIIENECVYLPEIYEAEQKVAERIVALSNSATNEFEGVEEDLEKFLQEKGIELEEKQREAVITFTKGQGGVYILNGNAGCGKTFTLKIILRVLAMQYKKRNKKMKVRVFAPTGKASKVAEKATGIPCMTIHRGLKYRANHGFEYNENHPLDVDCVVVDESSMIDILLAKALLSAIPDGTKVIFLGDTKQLPSVGAGNVLQDLIDSGIVKVVTLNVVKRQGEDSGIIRNANRIIRGEMISTCKDTKDAYVLRKETLLEAQMAILKSIREIQKVKGYDIEDIQVLCPQKNGLVGTNAMNYLIQQALNPYNEDAKVLNKKIMVYNHHTQQEEWVNLFFKRGDKVIHTRNNYDMIWYRKDKFGNYIQDYDVVGITNGETGVIEDIVRGKFSDNFKMRVIVRYEDRYVFYDDYFEELDHAYALTVHKSQGSQWKAVIIPIMMENYHMLDNNLLYTAYTRAQTFCVVVGQAEAILYAIQTYKTRNRYTSLKEKIRALC
jgi:exodeoxyribonuclease V alpha subunit